ncbi:MAG: squalene--hopene cyclase [Planctomycetes bacterium]|nr:squalene--hopene cyclase [Planctomycetota bacterium]
MERTLYNARNRLLTARVAGGGHWEGRLSSSALSTATAIVALELVRRQGGAGGDDIARLVGGGLGWLVAHQNGDGGFGDTLDSPSNVSTTTLAWAALGMHAERGEASAAFARTEAWLRREVGELTAGSLAGVIGRRYGVDRTFSVPILTLCALAGRFGEGRGAWDRIPRLPFELAAVPRSWFRWLGLPVVSYALPALIALGQVHHRHCPTRNPIARLARALARKRTLRVLEAIQPSSGGFLEATPLTSFVTMGLAAGGEAGHPVARRGVAFLAAGVREDGSWPIDVNLATWVTTLSVQALAVGGRLEATLSEDERRVIRVWLLRQQTRSEHVYTGAAPGGWAWTDLPGGVPDADDTPGALLALSVLGGGEEVRGAAAAGAEWLLGLQNRDGGIPTFCRGWGKLPFDRSSPDLTAHAVRAWSAWVTELPAALGARLDRARDRALVYLVETQRADGAWIPLWFGNQRAPGQANPVYGTARVLKCAALAPARAELRVAWRRSIERAVAWLVAAQGAEGGFGGAPGVPSSIEETALAVDALAGLPENAAACEAAARGARWLVERTAEGTVFPSTPIGLYFAGLWYSEALYPLVFTVSALGRVAARP